jgi:FtsH-binding integral membrane protein
MHASPRRIVAIAKAQDDHAWRRRTMLACGLLALAVLAAGAANLDWSEGPAMVVGQLAGMVTPLVLLGVGVWGAAALIGRKV